MTVQLWDLAPADRDDGAKPVFDFSGAEVHGKPRIGCSATHGMRLEITLKETLGARDMGKIKDHLDGTLYVDAASAQADIEGAIGEAVDGSSGPGNVVPLQGELA